MLCYTMANKNNKPLSPQELAKYQPEDILPKMQEEFPLGLNNVFNLATASGATVIGKKPKPENTQSTPPIKK